MEQLTQKVSRSIMFFNLYRLKKNSLCLVSLVDCWRRARRNFLQLRRRRLDLALLCCQCSHVARPSSTTTTTPQRIFLIFFFARFICRIDIFQRNIIFFFKKLSMNKCIARFAAPKFDVEATRCLALLSAQRHWCVRLFRQPNTLFFCVLLINVARARACLQRRGVVSMTVNTALSSTTSPAGSPRVEVINGVAV